MAAQPALKGIVNAASYDSALAPGTWAAIFGAQLAPTTAQASSVPLPYTLAGVSVSVGGTPAPLLYVSATQINALIPFKALPGAKIPVVVSGADGSSASLNIALGRSAPAIFTQNARGTGGALAFDEQFRPVSEIGSQAITLYTTGLGPTDPAPLSSTTGGVAAEPFNRVKDPLQV